MKFYLPVLSVLEQAVQDGLKAGGEVVLAESNRRAPEDTGDLKEAGFVDVEDLRVQVGYTSPKGFPYILRQHENLEYQHDDGEAKFLERAFKDAEAEVVDAVARRVKEKLGG